MLDLGHLHQSHAIRQATQLAVDHLLVEPK